MRRSLALVTTLAAATLIPALAAFVPRGLAAGPAATWTDTDTANEKAAWNAMQQLFVPQRAIDFNNCDIQEVVDYEQYRLQMPTFRDAWFYRDKSVEYYQRHGYEVLAIIVRKRATVITQAIFGSRSGPKAASCRFSLYASEGDKFGHIQTYLLASWGFTRELAAKVDWRTLDDRQFPALAPGYALGPEFLLRIHQEQPLD